MRYLSILLVAALPLGADDTKDAALAKEISLKGLELGQAVGKAEKPTVIASAEELAKAFPDKKAQIGKDVNFARHKLVYFSWSGSGQDKMVFEVAEKGKKKEVVFIRYFGLTDDLRHHHAVFALAKDAAWTIRKPE